MNDRQAIAARVNDVENDEDEDIALAAGGLEAPLDLIDLPS